MMAVELRYDNADYENDEYKRKMIMIIIERS